MGAYTSKTSKFNGKCYEKTGQYEYFIQPFPISGSFFSSIICCIVSSLIISSTKYRPYVIGLLITCCIISMFYKVRYVIDATSGTPVECPTKNYIDYGNYLYALITA